jgi:hypothetical protein
VAIQPPSQTLVTFTCGDSISTASVEWVTRRSNHVNPTKFATGLRENNCPSSLKLHAAKTLPTPLTRTVPLTPGERDSLATEAKDLLNSKLLSASLTTQRTVFSLMCLLTATQLSSTLPSEYSKLSLSAAQAEVAPSLKLLEQALLNLTNFVLGSLTAPYLEKYLALSIKRLALSSAELLSSKSLRVKAQVYKCLVTASSL